MARPKKEVVETPQVVQNTSQELVSALIQAIQATKPIEKKTAANRVPNTPWTPKDGSPKLKLKRPAHQHGLLLDPEMLKNEEIAWLNQLKPGRFLDNWVKVTKRRDKGVDIDYPVKTAAQRLKLVNQFGIRNFAELLQRCVEEAKNPVKVMEEDE